MEYAVPSDPLLLFAFYSGLAVSQVSLVVVGVIAVLRHAIDQDKRQEEALAKRWQPVFFHAVEGLPFPTPRVRKDQDWEAVLLLWVHFTESIRGVGRRRLRDLALDLGLEGVARRLLRRRRMGSRLMAAVALGRLESAEAFPELAVLAEDPHPLLSLLAIRSLVQIDPRRGVPLLLERLGRRGEWPLIRVAAMLEEVPPEVLAPSLLAGLGTAPPAGAARLISLINVAHVGDTWPVLAPFLGSRQPTDVLAAALKACQDPRALEAVRSLAVHGEWIVRAQAAATLGRIGVEEDRLRLQAMLSDRQWWVRYRAASALAAFPGMSRNRLQELCSRLDDPFAADILNHVLAEKSPETAR